MSQVVIDAFSSCYCHVVVVNICFLEFHGPVVASWWRAAQGLESWDRRGLGDLGSRRVNKHQKALGCLGCLGSGCRNPHIWMSVYSLYYFCMLIIHWDHHFSWFRHRHAACSRFHSSVAMGSSSQGIHYTPPCNETMVDGWEFPHSIGTMHCGCVEKKNDGNG